MKIADGARDPMLYVEARRVLLDALDALASHRDAITVVGAQPGGRRGARLPSHARGATRRARGLEATLVDRSPVVVRALDPRDPRTVVVHVAGVAALLVAKAHKLHDRVDSDRRDRVDDKDAADVVRLMQTTSPRDVGRTFAALQAHPAAGMVSTEALRYIEQLFGRSSGTGVVMATRALELAVPAARVQALCTAYTAQLLAAQ